MTRSKFGDTPHYFVYPFDFWEILGSFIRPEEVGTFARLCHATYAVVNRPSFWIALYKKYYKPAPGIPERLQPDCMVRARGMRAHVIRALYYTYDPFIHRMGDLRKSIFDPHILKDRICVKSWQTNYSRLGLWKVYIKFQRASKLAESSATVLWDKIKPKVNSLDAWDDEDNEDDIVDNLSMAVNSSALIRELDDIHHNPESGCSILHMQTTSFCRIPPAINGMRLVDVCKTMTGSAFQYQRLRLKFVPAHYRFSQCDSLETIVINDIVGMKVYDWYHTHYEMAESYVHVA